MNTQKAEADDLRKQLAVASNAAIQANKAASSQLEACLIEERHQASVDRQNLLSQITSLVNASGEAQDTRFTSKIGAIQQTITSSMSQFEAATTRYAEGMDTWDRKEKSLADGVVTSRDHLKAKMQQDWTVSEALPSHQAMDPQLIITIHSGHKRAKRRHPGGDAGRPLRDGAHRGCADEGDGRADGGP